MKLPLIDVLLFSLTFVFFVIGVYELMVVGLAESYWLFMVSVGFLMIYNLRKPRNPEPPPPAAPTRTKKKSSRSSR